MNSLFNDAGNDPVLRSSAADDGVRSGRMRSAADREFTLSTGTVLAMFLGLAVLCAAFFGFGYSLGRKSGQVAASANLPADTDSASTAATPAPAHSPEPESIPSVPAYAGDSNNAAKPAATKAEEPAPKTEPAPAAVKPPSKPLGAATPPASTPAKLPAATKAEAPAPVAADATPAKPAANSGAVYVQVAAVSHADDANAMVAALRRKGYVVATRQSPSDSLIHIQLGPFSSRKEAEAMKQRLSGDGYNAILK